MTATTNPTHQTDPTSDGLARMLEFPFVAALTGRRARRFAMGDVLPDGPLAYVSQHAPVPLSELERMLVVTAMGGTTGWNYMITRHARYAPHLSNYTAAAGGRTFPSAAGFHTSELFFTDDSGVYKFETRDAHPVVMPDGDGALDVQAWVDAHRARIRKLADERLYLPAEEPYLEGHNTWCVNVPGSLLVVPVADIAQHAIAGLCFLVQNGIALSDDVHGEPIAGIERFSHLVDTNETFPLTVFDQYMLTEATAELATSCYAGALTLQAMGLGGWMFDGIDRFSLLGASGNPDVPGLGFDYQTDDRWPVPHITGRRDVFESYTVPHHPSMRAAVEAFVERKYGPGGPLNPETPGPWKESARVRGSAEVHDEEFIACVTTMAEHVFDRFGKFPATVPAVFSLTYLQAHHLDLDFYDHHFGPGSYLSTHAEHRERWHGTP